MVNFKLNVQEQKKDKMHLYKKINKQTAFASEQGFRSHRKKALIHHGTKTKR